MYGKYVTLMGPGYVIQVWVGCTQYTPLEILEERAWQSIEFAMEQRENERREYGCARND